MLPEELAEAVVIVDITGTVEGRVILELGKATALKLCQALHWCEPFLTFNFNDILQMNVNPNPILRIESLKESEPSSCKGASQAAPAQAGGATKVEISASSRQLAELSDDVSQSSDVRTDLVAQFKSQLASGTYQVDYQQLASNLAKGQ